MSNVKYMRTNVKEDKVFFEIVYSGTPDNETLYIKMTGTEKDEQGNQQTVQKRLPLPYTIENNTKKAVLDTKELEGQINTIYSGSNVMFESLEIGNEEITIKDEKIKNLYKTQTPQETTQIQTRIVETKNGEYSRSVTHPKLIKQGAYERTFLFTGLYNWDPSVMEPEVLSQERMQEILDVDPLQNMNIDGKYYLKEEDNELYRFRSNGNNQEFIQENKNTLMAEISNTLYSEDPDVTSWRQANIYPIDPLGSFSTTNPLEINGYSVYDSYAIANYDVTDEKPYGFIINKVYNLKTIDGTPVTVEQAKPEKSWINKAYYTLVEYTPETTITFYSDGQSRDRLFLVDWGDNNIEEITVTLTSGDLTITHTYETPVKNRVIKVQSIGFNARMSIPTNVQKISPLNFPGFHSPENGDKIILDLTSPNAPDGYIKFPDGIVKSWDSYDTQYESFLNDGKIKNNTKLQIVCDTEFVLPKITTDEFAAKSKKTVPVRDPGENYNGWGTPSPEKEKKYNMVGIEKQADYKLAENINGQSIFIRAIINYAMKSGNENNYQEMIDNLPKYENSKELFDSFNCVINIFDEMDLLGTSTLSEYVAENTRIRTKALKDIYNTILNEKLNKNKITKIKHSFQTSALYLYYVKNQEEGRVMHRTIESLEIFPNLESWSWSGIIGIGTAVLPDIPTNMTPTLEGYFTYNYKDRSYKWFVFAHQGTFPSHLFEMKAIPSYITDIDYHNEEVITEPIYYYGEDITRTIEVALYDDVYPNW